jgi:hypothetical protein
MLTFLNAGKSKSSPFSARDTPSITESQSDNSSLLLGYQQQEGSHEWSALSLDKDLVDELDQELDDESCHDETTPKKLNSPEKSQNSKDFSTATLPDAGYITLEEHDLDHLDFDDDEEHIHSQAEFNNTTAEIQKLENLLGEELKDDSVFLGATTTTQRDVSEDPTSAKQAVVDNEDATLDLGDKHQELLYTDDHKVTMQEEYTPPKSSRGFESIARTPKTPYTDGNMMDQVMQEVEYLRDLNEKLVKVNEEYRDALGNLIYYKLFFGGRVTHHH